MRTEERIVSLARESGSLDLAKAVARTMRGRTFHHHYHFLYDVRTLLGPERKVYLEIGVYHGGSLALMLHHPYDTDLHGVDPLDLPDQAELARSNIETFNTRGRSVTLHRGRSQDPVVLRRLEALPVDLLFIDGDHSGATVLRDFEAYAPRVRPGGFILFDDYIDPLYSPEVRPAVDAIVEDLRTGRRPGDYEILGRLAEIRPGPGEPALSPTFLLRKLA